MMSSKVNSITLPATLAGLVLCLASPAAHGHGNNPAPDLGDTAPWAPDRYWPGPGALPLPDMRDGPTTEEMAADGIVGPFVVSAGQPDAQRSVGMLVADQAMQSAPAIDGGSIRAPLDAGFGDPIGVQPRAGTVMRMPSGGAIPAPGTLALLGLAALAAGRSRRRRG